MPKENWADEIHEMLRDDALDFYTGNLQGKGMSDDRAFQELRNECYTNDVLHELEAELSNLRFSDFKKRSKSDKQALSDLHKKAKKLHSMLGHDKSMDGALKSQ